MNRSSRLGFPPGSPVDRPCSVRFNFGSGLNFAVVDPFEQFVLVKVNFTALAAARNLTQAGECIDRDRTPLLFLRLQMLYRSLQLFQLGKDTPDGIRQVFESQFLLFFHNDNILMR